MTIGNGASLLPAEGAGPVVRLGTAEQPLSSLSRSFRPGYLINPSSHAASSWPLLLHWRRGGLRGFLEDGSTRCVFELRWFTLCQFVPYSDYRAPLDCDSVGHRGRQVKIHAANSGLSILGGLKLEGAFGFRYAPSRFSLIALHPFSALSLTADDRSHIACRT